MKRSLSMERRHERTALVIILAVSVLLRLASALYQGDRIEPLPGVHDQISYHTLAGRVLEGYGFSFAADWWPLTRAGEPTAHWSFLYTLYLALVYLLFGPHPLAARLIQAVLVGVLHPWLAWRIGNRVFGAPAGLCAALTSALYAYFVFYGGSLMTESFYILAILWTLDLAISMGRAHESNPAGPSRTSWILLGIALGSAALLRQLILLLTPIIIAWLWWMLRSQPVRQKSLGTLLSAAAIAAMIVPWTLRNYRAFGSFVPLNTNSGFAFFWGNHPIHGTRFIPILPPDGPSYSDLIPKHLRSLDEAALDKALLAEGLYFVRNDPGRYVMLSLSRLEEYFKFWPTQSSGALSNLARTASFGVLLPLTVLGLVVGLVRALRPGKRRPFERNGAGSYTGISLLILFAAAYSFIHLLSWALIRYRLPVDAICVVLASIGLAYLAEFALALAGIEVSWCTASDGSCLSDPSSFSARKHSNLLLMRT